MIEVEIPSPKEAGAHLAQIRQALEAVHAGLEVPIGTVVWPAGLDRSLMDRLPLTGDARIAVLRELPMRGSVALDAQGALWLRGLTPAVLADLLLALEEFLAKCAVSDAQAKDSFGSALDRALGRSPSRIGQPLADRGLSGIPRADPAAESPPANGGSDEANAEPRNLPTMLPASTELPQAQELTSALRSMPMDLASKVGIAEDRMSADIRQVARSNAGLRSAITDRLRAMVADVPEKLFLVLKLRIVQTPPVTLAEIGRQLGITREGVRQLQRRLESRIRDAMGEEFERFVPALQSRLPPIMPMQQLDRHVDEIAADEDPVVEGVFKRELLSALQVSACNGFYASESATGIIREMKRQARKGADDVGLVDDRKLAEMLPAPDWRRFWAPLIACVGVHTLYGTLALRDTAKARVKAALLSIGRPATRDEVASVCGFTRRQAGAVLSNVPSMVRSDRVRWGLKEWVEDVYSGIAREIIRCIERDGGKTDVNALVNDIARKYDVRPQSVRAFTTARKFAVSDGMISMADPSKLRLRNLDDIVHGRDESGAPYWTFVVRQDHFKGHSASNVPVEFAQEVGCNFDSGIRVSIANLPGTDTLSLQWRLTSLTGAYLGYLTRPLERLGFAPGDRVRVTIRGRKLVELSRDRKGADKDRRSWRRPRPLR